MPFPTTSDFHKSDRDLLLQFLQAFRELLGNVVETGRDPRGSELFAMELMAPMRSAFSEVQDHFGRLQSAVREGLPPERIAEHGLSGQQLRFKLATVSYRAQRYLQLGGFFRFQWLLDTIEGLLDSIIDAAGVGGAIKEYKEAVRNAGKDGD